MAFGFAVTFVPFKSSAPTGITPFDPAAAIFVVAGDDARGKSFILGGITFQERIGNWQGEDCFIVAIPNVPPPVYIDPPFPPVYPYLFATDPIYGRENLSLNFQMVRMDDYVFEATVILDSLPVNLTDSTLIFTAKWSVKDLDSAAVFQLTSGTPQLTITNALLGQYRVDIPSSATSLVPLNKTELVYDIQMLTPVGKRKTIQRGILIVVPDVTLN